MPRRDLPPELWLLVFTNLVPTPPQIEPRRLKPDYTDPLRMPDLTPVLRQWYVIAAPLLYSAPEVEDLGKFLLG
ncbi:hypothetical protein EHS25_006897 [Saitozyma podzolica]|uniref:Uncharacterized protein n=1 Tax=Saitozyma podzolica TaxID=1890683 RepID=A0A427XRD1_9TREE|nr:hypothetical protein EHS25_006897 [Saitozyma podzolica]